MSPTAAAPRAAILLAVGPGQTELERLADLGAALAAFAPRLTRLLLVDDGHRPGALLDAVPPALRPAARVIPNPRRGSELGWREGLNIAIWTGLAELANEGAWDFVLKLDTDSLVIAPPLDAIASVFRATPGAGLVGTWRRSPAGQETGWAIFTPWVRLLEKTFAQYRDPVTQRRRFRVAPGPRGRFQRRLLRDALAQGYVPGEHCQGGGYALSGRALSALASSGALSDSRLWGNVPLTEDVSLALCVRAQGFSLAAANGPGQPFGVQYQGLAFPPAELLARGHSVVHSIKNDPAFPEAEIRSFFRERR
jgi:hypothetical protein